MARTETTSLWPSTTRSLPGIGRSPKRNSDVLYSEERILLAANGEWLIFNFMESSGLVLPSGNALQTPETDEDLSRC